MTDTMRNKEEILNLVYPECTRILVLLESKRKQESLRETI